MTAMHAARRALAPLLALFLVALGAFFVAESIPQLRGQNRPLWVNYYLVWTELTQRTWSDPYVLGAGGALLAVGLLLVLAGTRRGPRPIRLASTADRVRVEMPRRDVRRWAEAAALTLDDVTEAKVKASRRRIRVKAATHPGATNELEGQIRQRVGEQIGVLAPARRGLPRVRVRLDRKGR